MNRMNKMTLKKAFLLVAAGALMFSWGRLSAPEAYIEMNGNSTLENVIVHNAEVKKRGSNNKVINSRFITEKSIPLLWSSYIDTDDEEEKH